MNKRILTGGAVMMVLVAGVWVLARRTSSPNRASETENSCAGQVEEVARTPRPQPANTLGIDSSGSTSAPGTSSGQVSAPEELSASANQAIAEEVRNVLAALHALYEPAGSLDWNAAKALLARREQATKELLERLAQLGEGGAQAMAAALGQTESLRAKLLLVQGLGKVNDSQAAAVLQSLLNGEESFSLRKEVVVALGQRRDAAAEQALAGLLSQQGDAQLRFASAQGLAGREGALATMAERLRQETAPEVRGELIHSIGLVRNPAAMNVLAEMAQSQEGELLARKIAIQELGRSFGVNALPVLDRLLQDPEESVRKSAVGATARVQSAEAVALLQKSADTDRSSLVSEAATAALASVRHSP